jgi:hypothetical protein
MVLTAVLDYPGGVFPTGDIVDPALDPRDPPYDFKIPHDKIAWENYDPELLAGAPLALQVVARRWEDEKAMAALKMIAEVVQV